MDNNQLKREITPHTHPNMFSYLYVNFQLYRMISAIKGNSWSAKNKFTEDFIEMQPPLYRKLYMRGLILITKGDIQSPPPPQTPQLEESWVRSSRRLEQWSVRSGDKRWRDSAGHVTSRVVERREGIDHPSPPSNFPNLKTASQETLERNFGNLPLRNSVYRLVCCDSSYHDMKLIRWREES